MLVTKEYIITEAFSRKISESRLQDSIVTACEIKYLKPILGVDFYNAVVLTPASYTALLVYVKPMIAWYVKYMLLPELKTEISDLGVNRISVQSAQNADEESYGQARAQALIVAEAHREQLIDHLNDNTSTYPLFYSGNTPDNKTEIVAGIIFRKPASDLDEDDQWYKPS
jgi:hypothetical protein